MSPNLRRSHGLALGLVLVSGSNVFAQQVLHTVYGDSAHDELGRSVDFAGDVNGDGFDDLVLGAEFDDDNGADAGRVRVVSGKDGGTLFDVDGDLPGDRMGFASSGAGDVDGDGYPDICAAAFGADVGGLIDVGSVKLVSGKTGALLHLLTGTSANDFFGWSVSPAGDVNGDGFGDVLVGAVFEDAPGLSDCGSVTLVSGKDGSVLFKFFGGAVNEYLGGDVSPGGDANADGFLDLVGGAPFAAYNGPASGRVNVYSGLDGSTLRSIDGGSALDAFGHSVDGGFDVDADGFSDVLVGARLDEPGAAFINSGSVSVISARTWSTLYTFYGDSKHDELGGAVRWAGDVNRDGYADLAAGAHLDDVKGSNTGIVRVWSGRDGAKLYKLEGDAAGDVFGWAIGAGGDLNGDGWPDIAVGAPHNDKSAFNAGSARVWSLVPKGITHFGSGSIGCAGPQSLTGNGAPSIGEAGFELIGAAGPASGVGYLLLSDKPDGAGSDPFGVSALFHLKLPPIATLLALLPSTSDAIGSYRTALPLPSIPSLVGLVVYAQHASVWPAPCAGVGAANVSTSNGVRLKLQP